MTIEEVKFVGMGMYDNFFFKKERITFVHSKSLNKYIISKEYEPTNTIISHFSKAKLAKK